MSSSDPLRNDPLRNDRGVALIMVLTAITLLSTIMLSFSLDTTVNKLKTYNIEDKAQAKLTAEAGLKFAMTRLKLYKDAYNYVINNDGVKSIAKPELLNIIWNFPFIYPIPVTKNMNKIQQEALEKFQEATLLKGQMRLTISNLSNRLNLNALRLTILKDLRPDEDDGSGNPTGGSVGDSSTSSDAADEKYNLENQLINSLSQSFQNKLETDDDFNSLYSGIEVTELVDTMKYNVSDKDSLENIGNLRGKFSKIETAPKQAPLASMSEVYTLPEWSDDIVDLIKNEFTVHGAIMVDLNKITDKLLRILIPEITDDEVKDFFEYKNDPEDPKFFNTKEDFKKYIVQVGNLMSSDDFDKLINEFEKNGIKFGPSASLFKIISIGEQGRSTYTLEAYVSLPPKPSYRKQVGDDDPQLDASGNPIVPGNPASDGTSPTTDTSKPDKEPKVFLLNPRILEVYAK